FFFQAEDGIRDDLVTGVQTCALPIYGSGKVVCSTGLCGPEPGGHRRCGAALGIYSSSAVGSLGMMLIMPPDTQNSSSSTGLMREIGRASCRERVEIAEE